MAARRLSRRAFLSAGTATLAAAMVACDRAGDRHATAPAVISTRPQGDRGVVPLEAEPHRRCWMAWPSSREIWGNLLPGIQHDIALVATTVARFEPVTLCAGADQVAIARDACGRGVDVVGDVPVDDCWMRDSGPIFTLDGPGSLGAVGLNFNGWGGRQVHDRDADVAERVAALAAVPFRRADLVAEGGAIETDGAGTLLATESSVVNDNRNPGRTKAQLEAALFDAYGATAIRWVPGLRDRDITDDHIDATSRFLEPGRVLVQLPPSSRTDVWAQDARQQHDLLSGATDGRGVPLEVEVLHGPQAVRSTAPDFLDSYVNFYPANGAVITAGFGDAEADRAAAGVLERLFPGREIVQLDVDRLHAGGGGIHCVTQQEPSV